MDIQTYAAAKQYTDNLINNKINLSETPRLSGTIEISVTTDTNVACAQVFQGQKNVVGANLTLRNVYNGESLEDFEPPNIQVHSVLYRGTLYVILKSYSGNIPQGTYTVDWSSTKISGM